MFGVSVICRRRLFAHFLLDLKGRLQLHLVQVDAQILEGGDCFGVQAGHRHRARRHELGKEQQVGLADLCHHRRKVFGEVSFTQD